MVRRGNKQCAGVSSCDPRLHCAALVIVRRVVLRCTALRYGAYSEETREATIVNTETFVIAFLLAVVVARNLVAVWRRGRKF